MVDWDRIRREDSSLDLRKGFDLSLTAMPNLLSEIQILAAHAYLETVESMKAIHSRQAAAIAIATAMIIVSMRLKA